jgi:RNA polymerase sigma-70 factor (ECF subfamily)
MDHLDIIARCTKGDRQSHEQLYKMFAPYLYAIIRNYVLDDYVKKDLLQDTFVKIFENLHLYDETKGELKSWMARITINTCINHIRKTNKHGITYGLEVLSEPNNHWEPDIFASLSKEDIESILEKMPNGYRTIFILSVIDGYGHTEIAEMLEITPETSRSQLSRGISWIKNNIDLHLKRYKYGIEF